MVEVDEKLTAVEEKLSTGLTQHSSEMVDLKNIVTDNFRTIIAVAETRRIKTETQRMEDLQNFRTLQEEAETRRLEAETRRLEDQQERREEERRRDKKSEEPKIADAKARKEDKESMMTFLANQMALIATPQNQHILAPPVFPIPTYKGIPPL